MTAPQTPLRVVGAVAIRDDGLVYASQRPPGGLHGGLWEFPGGKVEAGESDKAALQREIQEELRVDSSIQEHVATGTDGHIELHCYRVVFLAEPVPNPPRIGAWFHPEELQRLEMPPADAPAKTYAIDSAVGVL